MPASRACPGGYLGNTYMTCASRRVDRQAGRSWPAVHWASGRLSRPPSATLGRRGRPPHGPPDVCLPISPARPGPGRWLRYPRRRPHFGRLGHRATGENLTHRYRELSISPATWPSNRSVRTAGVWSPVPRLAERGMQLFGGLAGRGGLGGVCLRCPQFGHCVHERDQVPGQCPRMAHAAAAGLAGQRQQPRCGPQPIPFLGPARNAAVRCPGRPVIPIGRAPQHPAAGHPRRGVQRVRGRPRRVRSGHPDHRRRSGAGAPRRRRPAGPRAGRPRRVPAQ